jgi:hypothetical protein
MTAPGTTETRLITDLGEIRRTLGLLLQPGQVTELRALDVSTPSYRRPHTVSGYFNDVEALVESLGSIERSAKGIYIVPNPIDPALLARAVNRLRDVTDREPLTGDRDIVSRRWLLIDADPRRPSGISSTDVEHHRALERVRQIRDALALRGWPEPIIGDSGNGGHLLYPIVLPRDDDGLVTRVLQALGFQFDDDAVTIDQTVFNPARIWKLYGTVARKGDSTPDRSHRLARILEVPTTLAYVDRDLLEALAGMRPESEARQVPTSGRGDAFDLDTWIGRSGLELLGPSPWQGGRRWIFRVCPWNADHRDRSAYLLQHASGAVAAGCHHNGCSGKDWHALRDVIEPDWRERRRPTGGPVGGRPSRWDTAAESARWPEPPGAPAFRGLAGRIVEAVAPHTEADPVAVLVSFLAAFGCAVGSGPHALVGATRHPPREYAAVVGRTSKARKGDSWQPNKTLFTLATPAWSGRLMGGLSTGEGLISAVRDPVVKNEPIKEKGRVVGYEEVVVDEGEPDKRLLVVEPELARVLRVMGRQGNTLSAILRDAWDTGDLRSMTRKDPLSATGAHVALLGHITIEELRRELSDVEAANGFANRITWFAVRRSKKLPEPEVFGGVAVEKLAEDLALTVQKASTIGLMARDPDARELWRDVYDDLSDERDGLAGAILARAEAHVLRFSLAYALLDGTSTVTVEHLAAALELWAYAERSVEFIFGDATGDPVADAIAEAIVHNGALTRTQIRDLFGRHESSGRIDQALQMLLRRGRVRVEKLETGGRPVEVWVPA